MLQTAPLPTISGRYRLIEQMGTGGIGVVYRATDLLYDTDVALKLLKAQQLKAASIPTDTQDVRLMLAREFKMLAALRHPNIISVLDYGFDSDRQPYFTMELLEKAQTIIQAGRDQSEQQRVYLLVQLLQALIYLHRRGTLHRDLKPSNIMVVQTASGAKVKLLDFGLAQTRDEVKGGEEIAVGTLFYMAPEVLRGEPATELADLYAVGLIAYELFSGRYPFKLESISKLVETLKNVAPDFEAIENPNLRPVIARLLTKDPVDRYQDAHTVMVDLCTAAGMEPPPESIAIRESFLQAAELVGRGPELNQLKNALAETLAGKGSMWLVGGESGVGKSRLVEEIRAVGMVRGAMVLRGQAMREGGSAYHIWQPIVRRLLLTREANDFERAVLQQVLPTLDAPTHENDALLETALPGVIADFIQGQGEPVLLILEDIQWMEAESAALFQHLNEMVGSLPVMIVATFSTDVNPNVPLMLPRARLMHLERLNEREIAQLSEAMLGPNGRLPRLVAFLQRETEGNAFFLVEIVRTLAEEAGQLDRVGYITLPNHIITAGVQQLIQRRLTRVPADCEELLKMAALAGRYIDVELLQVLEPQTDVEAWLGICADAAVLEVHDRRWRFAHDKLRAVVVASIEVGERLLLHRRIAVAIEALPTSLKERIAALNYHWGQAGDHERASQYRLTDE